MKVLKALLAVLTALAVALTACVVVFGAFVRLSDAGLSCPDWPTCYGRATWPSASQDVAAHAASGKKRPNVLYCIAVLQKSPAGLKCRPVGFLITTLPLTILILLFYLTFLMTFLTFPYCSLNKS